MRADDPHIRCKKEIASLKAMHELQRKRILVLEEELEEALANQYIPGVDYGAFAVRPPLLPKP